MRVHFTRRDSADECPTRRVAITVDGERQEVTVFSTGTSEPVSRAVGEALIDSETHAVEPYEPAADGELTPAVTPLSEDTRNG
ncbi:hypothetical protein ACFPYI_01895 [Halomarina salina]|uniref:Uncharacterized protein n=1 Tax=Halomarina salina TaxID=1872699 RepID=A0ABD5RI98_9EURY|nr:hypothetical protein [Halomarina salina]